MSQFKKKLAEYRQLKDGDWRKNFKHVNYACVDGAIRRILTEKRPYDVRDRHGNVVYSDKTRMLPLSLDEQVFQIAVLIDTQAGDAIHPDNRKEQE